jgi:NhaP-type Na+/H+ or K+/H+ antiporter
MHHAMALVIIALALTAYALVSRRLSTTIVSGPIVFMVVGIAIGPAGADLVSIGRGGELIRALLEFTLVLVLFADAMAIRSAALRRQDFVPIRLLGVGFPLSMVLGGLAALVVFGELNVWEAALLGVILAPTDASLGLATISDTRVPQLIRQALNVESGLNDGLALPFFTLALAAAAETSHASTTGILEVFVRSLLLSAALGGVVGWVAGRVLVWSRSGGWLDDGWARVAVIAIATLAYALALQVQGSGFIAAWVAGLAFGTALRGGAGGPQGHDTGGLAEELGGLFVALSYLAFGAVMLGPVLAHVGWREVLYGLLSLTVIRMLPVAVASISSGLRRPTVLYMGWFGPRGLASIVFALIALEDMIPGIEVVVATVAITVGLSVLLHGASSAWGAARYGAWYAAAVAREPNLVEGGAAPERRIGRRGHRTPGKPEPDVED